MTSSGATTVVETRCGRVSGITRSGVLQFRGLPFAAPPVGPRRWLPPQAPEPWAGTRVADRFGPIAPQQLNEATLLPRPVDQEMSEDCLSLNVFTPSTEGSHRPVLVWIHGGAFETGSGRDRWYDGSAFARAGAVVVTVNYRLGVLGFLDVGDLVPGSANRGLQDQVAALRWVRDNIAAFGGDPGRVTVFGESAGAMSIGALLGMPAARGLFHRAILQSGAASSVQDAARAAAARERVSARLGGPGGLLTAPVERILEVQTELSVEASRGVAGLPFVPLVDGEVLPRRPLQAIRDGSAAGVSLVTGTTRHEMTLFLLVLPEFAGATDAGVADRLERRLPGRGRELVGAYRALLGPAATAGDVWVAIESDRVFRLPAIRLAEAASRRGSGAWMYLFTWESPAAGGVLRSCHALDVPFVWSTNGLVEGFAGSGPGAERLAADMGRAWLDFASTGDPGWDRYEPARRRTRIFGPGDGVVDDPLGETRRLWDWRSGL
jgi:para-nitrobenzyl esterase